jgi:hypothetical protein
MEYNAPACVLGPVLANALLQCLCEGIILGQLSRYQQEYSDDSNIMKSYVYVVGFATMWVLFCLVKFKLSGFSR